MITKSIFDIRRTVPAMNSQSGATLVELMVGIVIGLMAVAVATGALMISRGVSSTVSDASLLQQQAAFAFRVFGQQIRQAGSMRLNLAVNQAAGTVPNAEDLVAFSPDTQIYSLIPNVAPTVPLISGIDAPSPGAYKLSVAYQNYEENIFPAGASVSLFRDCTGAGGAAANTIIRSRFELTSGVLRCAGTDNIPQPMIRNVADFQVRYLVQDKAAAYSGLPTLQYVDAAGVPAHISGAGQDWSQVFGVEVCLVLYAEEAIDMPAGTTYKGCDASAVAVDITAAGMPAEEKNRLHMTFRSVYQLRSQGSTD